jgi:hypothetical protein
MIFVAGIFFLELDIEADSLVFSSVVEPKLFVSAPALALTFKKFRLQSRLQLRLQLCNYLFAQLLNQKVDFSCF